MAPHSELVSPTAVCGPAPMALQAAARLLRSGLQRCINVESRSAVLTRLQPATSQRTPGRHARCNTAAAVAPTLPDSRSSADSVSSNGPEPSTSGRSNAYPFSDIEARWQAFWDEHKTFRTPELSELDTSKPKFYALDMFPYPSGSGLHVGHPEGYTATDIVARYKRMRGFNVLHPMGWDAFGLPAEQYAIQTGTHPAVTTERNIDRFREQLKSLGFSYDWNREVSTCRPEYYKWTQWIFLQLFHKGLAYQAEVPVNWCPALGTVLANEEIVDGLSERGGHPVVRMPMKQWMLRITAYADRLLEDLDDLDWADSIKEMQRNWIGRSEGATVSFAVPAHPHVSLDVYTTRADTLFGATYLVLSPDHPLLGTLCAPEQRAQVDAYAAAAARKSDLERTDLAKTKTGVSLGCHAVNPATGESIPIWVADYVLSSYGSGAIMAVPGHDTRDFEFAQTFGLPVRRVVADASTSGCDDTLPFAGYGVAVDSANSELGLDINGLPTAEAQARTISWLEERGTGARQVNYKLRDWLFARQRYWGEPFPIIYPEGSEEPVAIPASDLPLVLPETDNFRPSGTPDPPLARITDWVNTVDPASGRPAMRETSTMPQWAGSCWYYLRYVDPANRGALVGADEEKYWMPVDLYVGGAEHAVLHLLYARFWHKVLFDLGVVSTKEPFHRLVSQGMILGEVEYTTYQDAEGRPVEEGAEGAVAVRVDPSEVNRQPDGCVLKSDPSVRVSSRAHKMSKSRGNVINPDDVVFQYGADSLRLYEMFMGPLRDTKVWQTKGVEGVHRFLARFYRLLTEGVSDSQPTKDQLRLLHLTIKKVTEETEEMRFNTAISAMMEFVNGAYKWESRPHSALEPAVLLLAPYAPHLAEEMWGVLGQEAGRAPGSLAYEPWPVADESLLVQETYNLPVQINGKMRGMVEVPNETTQDAAVAAAQTLASVAKQLDGKTPKKVIFVSGKIINIIVGK